MKGREENLFDLKDGHKIGKTRHRREFDFQYFLPHNRCDLRFQDEVTKDSKLQLIIYLRS